MFAPFIRIQVRLLLRPVLVAATGWLSLSCTAPESETCSSGIVCPIGSTCAANGEVCITDDCGDGKVEGDERCDDGNKDNGDGCSSDCTSLEVCGDGHINHAKGEVCDDGNRIDGDGCSADCDSKEECGDHVVDPGEECDDGNRVSRDGCREDCKSDETCGNGIVDFHLDEKCDPGLTPDECNDDCTSNLSCGNNFVDPDEQCDDGNNGDNTDDCITTDGAACRAAYCGDGLVRENPQDPADLEECDDSGESEDCNNDCTEVKRIIPGSPAGCGDGIINATIGETCDDGAKNGQHGYCGTQCNSPLMCGDGILTLPEVCDTAIMSSVFDSQGSVVACRAGCDGYEDHCGDGKITGGELCDNGHGNDDDTYDGCKTDCTPAAHCGDKIKDPLEQCDDPNGNKEDPEWRQSIDLAQCSMTCRLGPYCGDKNLQPDDEVCEIGQIFNVATLTATRSAPCNSDCQGYCGDGTPNNDGTLDGSPEDYEGCDLGPITYDDAGNPSGNGQDGDGAAVGGAPDSDSCRSDCTRCGDGVLQSDGLNGEPKHGEGCDDGERNVERVEYNDDKKYTCNHECQVNPYCGDGEENGPDEQCDNGSGNNGSPDSNCTADCTFKPYCGDGNQDSGEDCDEGDKNVSSTAYSSSGWQCNNQCKVNPYCGDSTCNDPDENHDNCPEDCLCGDGVCDDGENDSNCHSDCHCGNKTCELDIGENNSNCDWDCFCTNGQCEPTEDKDWCPQDCK